MNVELNTQIIEQVNETIDRSYVLRTENEIAKDYQDAIRILKIIKNAIDAEKAKYEDYLNDLVNGIGEQV